jgi:hypothetical protein
MKKRNLLMLVFMAFLITSCWKIHIGPIFDEYRYFICRVNTDGSGFKKLTEIGFDTYPFNQWEVEKIYTTEDEQLVIIAKRIYLFDPTLKTMVPISNELTDPFVNLTFAQDNKFYYCDNGDVFCYDFQSSTTANLTLDNSDYLMRPTLCPGDSLIILSKNRYFTLSENKFVYLKISDHSIHEIPASDAHTNEAVYNPLDDELYLDKLTGLYKCALDDSVAVQIVPFESWGDSSFGLTKNNDHIVFRSTNTEYRIMNLLDNTSYIINLDIDHAVSLQVAKNVNQVFYENLGYLYMYNLDNQQTVMVPNVHYKDDYMFSPTWDGKTIYFYAYIKTNKE